jgi:prepilin-type N-terminal cleavage/methylation domain-containing protein
MEHRSRVFATNSRRALSLVELVIVVALISVLAGVALPKWAHSLQKQRAAQAARRLAADLNRARSVAYASSRPVTVTFAFSPPGYTIPGVKPLHGSGIYSVNLADDPFRVRIVSVFGQTTPQTLTFSGYGQPSRGGEIVVAAGTAAATVSVDPDTGDAVVK